MLLGSFGAFKAQGVPLQSAGISITMKQEINRRDWTIQVHQQDC
jgi:hypothetical protein